MDNTNELTCAGIGNGQECWLTRDSEPIPFRCPSAMIVKDIRISGVNLVLFNGELHGPNHVSPTLRDALKRSLRNQEWAFNYHRSQMEKTEKAMVELRQMSEQLPPISNELLPSNT